jgi:transcriptional regulator
MPRDILESVQGTLESLVLKTLSWSDMHGYGIVRWIREQSGHELLVEEGTLYPALHRLEERGLVEADWMVSPTGRRARYYRLTSTGRRELEQRVDRWERYTRAVTRVLYAIPASR